MVRGVVWRKRRRKYGVQGMYWLTDTRSESDSQCQLLRILYFQFWGELCLLPTKRTCPLPV